MGLAIWNFIDNLCGSFNESRSKYFISKNDWQTLENAIDHAESPMFYYEHNAKHFLNELENKNKKIYESKLNGRKT